MKIIFLACNETLPGSPQRRVDAFEHDRQVAAIAAALKALDGELKVLNWDAPLETFCGADAAIIGTTWDYQNRMEEFLLQLETIQKAGVPVFNPPGLVRWNIDKSYLQELGERGAPIIPTLWPDTPSSEDLKAAFAHFQCEKLVLKRRIGAGAEGQRIFARNEPIPDGPLLGRPGMIQPFLNAITKEGEYSFIFIEGEFSHALIKRARQGDYRIQSEFGGREDPITPERSDLESAESILPLLPDGAPLYARIDMVRGDDGQLKLMEAELIEPYLYPEQGPDLGTKLANALHQRLS